MIVESGSLEAAHASGLYRYPHEVLDLIDVLTGVLAPLQKDVFLARRWKREERIDDGLGFLKTPVYYI